MKRHNDRLNAGTVEPMKKPPLSQMVMSMKTYKRTLSSRSVSPSLRNWCTEEDVEQAMVGVKSRPTTAKKLPKQPAWA